MQNMEIRQEIFMAGLKHWQVAQVLRIHPNTLTNWLRYDLTDEQREKIMGAIEELKNTATQERAGVR